MTCTHKHSCGCGSLSNANIKAVIEGLLTTALDEKDFDVIELKNSIHNNLIRLGDIQDKLNDFKADVALNLSALLTKTELASIKAELENLITSQQNIYEDLQRDFESVTSQKLLDYKSDVLDIQQDVTDQLNTVQNQIASLIPTRDAYKIAVQNGFVGSEASWLDSLKGLDAYDLAKAHGFRGSEAEWLSSLKGDTGPQGPRGPQGTPGIDGRNGVDGKNGTNGINGISAYEAAKKNGFDGSESAWLNSLIGEKGERGVGLAHVFHNDNDSLTFLFTDNTRYTTNSLKGEQGIQGPEAKSAYDIAVSHGFEGNEEDWLNYILENSETVTDLFADAASLEQFVNGSEDETVLTRLSAEYPTLQKAIKQLFENGGMPATPFKTKALMEASALVDGDYAQVTHDTTNNGLYVNTAGAWIKSEYDPLTQAKDYVDEKVIISLDDPDYLLSIADSESNLLFAINRQGEVIGDIKILLENISDLSTVLSHKDNIEGKLYEITDSQDNILAHVEADGTWVLPAIRTSTLDSTEITNLPDTLSSITIGDNTEGELYEIADPQGNILAQVESDGTWVVPAIRTSTLDSIEINGGNLNLGDSTVAGADITKERFIRIPEQRYLRLDLNFERLPTDSSVTRTPTSGTCTISDSSNNIIYVKANAELKVQGHGSANDKKRNYTIDFFNIDGKGLDLKFGDMIAHDSFHLKGFYRDPSHMRDQGGYRCWKELVQKLDYPYSKINNIVYTPSPTRPKNAEFTADAKYYPHGFPVEVHLNGEFFGLYTLRLKKSRNNYALDNSNTDHIFMDSGTYTAYLREPFDATDWEFKSPKMKGYDDLDPIPPEYIETVEASCIRLFEFTSTLKTSYPNHADYIVLPHWILWYLMAELMGDWDYNGNNYNLLTWNNQQWTIIPYDLDLTLNWYTGFGDFQSTNILSADIWTTFRSVYTPEIKELWTKYRKNGDITVENLAKHFRNAVKDIPREIYEADKDKWGSFKQFDGVNYPDLEQVYKWFEVRIEYLDSLYLIV